MKKFSFYLLFCAGLLAPSLSFSQSDYTAPKEMKARLQNIVSKYPSMAKMESIAKTPSSNEVLAVTLGVGDVANHPAIAVVAGVDPRHLVGVETSLQLVEDFLSREDAEQFLSKNTFYIFPCVNPDATEGFFGDLKYESALTKSLYDNDRDGLMSEDGVDDLNGDGIISSMIVETAGGEYIKHPDDNRVIIKADAAKGEKGKYKLFSEGKDNDDDGLINEDGVDGVSLNRNFTYKFKNWGAQSGDYPVSEVENRALLDFMYNAFNIHTVVALGVNDNMAEAPKYTNKTRKGVDLPKSADSENMLLDADNALATLVSEIYKTNNPKSNNILAETPLDGNFMEWAYYHYARNSFATTVWSVDQKDSRDSREAAYLKWADKNGVKDCYTEWSVVEHPDFEGETVELGSINPYAMYTPSLELIDDQIDATIKTISDIAALSPNIVLNVSTTEISKGVYRVVAKVVNDGAIATTTALGEKSYLVKYVRVELKLNGQKMVQGTRITTIPSLKAGGAEELSFIVEGKGSFELEVGSPQSGYVSKTVSL